MTYQECYQKGRLTLEEAGIEEAALDARLLLEHICHTNRNDLLVHGERLVEEKQENDYFALIEKRARRIPLQHLTGVQDFMGLEFAVNEHVLIPRQDTEILVEEVLKELHDGMRLLDMCTGSGCILLSLLHYSNDCQGVGVDISKDALKVARLNAERILGEEKVAKLNAECIVEMENTVGQIQLLESNLFEQVEGKFDFIVSNPPYIESAVVDTLMPEVRDHEPRLALDGMEDGLFFYRKIVEESRDYLLSGGMLYFEIGYNQAEAVSGLMRDAGFKEVKVIKDFAGLDRVVYGIYFRN